MRRILKEVKPLSADQLLNEILNAKGKQRSTSPEEPTNNRRLSLIHQQPRSLGFFARPNLKNLAGVPGGVKNYLNSPAHKPTLLPQAKAPSVPQGLKGALAEIKEAEEVSEGAEFARRRGSSSHYKTPTQNSNPNSQGSSPKDSFGHTSFAPRPMEGEKEWRNLRLKTQLMRRDTAITSMNGGLPDDFVHVKKFWNLDSMHQAQAARSPRSEADMSDGRSPSSSSPRSESAVSRPVTDLDSILYEQSVQQLLEETPTEIIYNHTEKSRAHKRRVSSSFKRSTASRHAEEHQQDASFCGQSLQRGFARLDLASHGDSQMPSERPEVQFDQFSLFFSEQEAGEESDYAMTPSDFINHQEDSIQLKAQPLPRKPFPISRRSKTISKPTDCISVKSVESHGTLSRRKPAALLAKKKGSQVAQGEDDLQSATLENELDASMHDEEDIQSRKCPEEGDEESSSEEPQVIVRGTARLSSELPPYVPFTRTERQRRILKFFERKRHNFGGKRFTYEVRKQVAEKRLRIKGRFVTKQQAFEILGLKGDEQNTNEQLQKLLEQHYSISQNSALPYSSHISQIMHIQLSKQAGSLLPSHQWPASSFICRPMLHATASGDGSMKLVKIRNIQTLFEPTAGEDTSMEPSQEDTTKKTSMNPSSAGSADLATLAEGSDGNYKSQQESVCRLLEALQKSDSKSLAHPENYIQPLFRVERVDRADQKDEKQYS